MCGPDSSPGDTIPAWLVLQRVTMQSGARLSRCHCGKLVPSGGGRFCRPRCYAPFSPAHGQDSVVRCDRPPLPAQAHPVKADRMIPRWLPAVPALSPMGTPWAFHPHGPSLQAHGATTEIRPAGSPGGALRVTGERASRHQVRKNWGARRHCGSGVRQQMSSRFHETVMGMALTRHSLSGTSRPGCPSALPCRPDCPEYRNLGTP